MCELWGGVCDVVCDLCGMFGGVGNWCVVSGVRCGVCSVCVFGGLGKW